MIDHPLRSSTERSGIACFHQESSAFMLTDFTRAIDVIRNHWFLLEHSLNNGARQTFAVRRVNNHIHRRNPGRNFAWIDETSHRNSIGDSKCLQSCDQSISPPTIAHPKQRNFRRVGSRAGLGEHFTKRIDHVIVTFQFRQSCDGSKNNN